MDENPPTPKPEENEAEENASPPPTAAILSSSPTGITLSAPAKNAKLVSWRGLVVAACIALFALVAVAFGIWRKQQQMQVKAVAEQEEQPASLNPNAGEAVVHSLEQQQDHKGHPAATPPASEPVPLIHTDASPKSGNATVPPVTNAVLTPEQQRLQQEYNDEQAALSAPLAAKSSGNNIGSPGTGFLSPATNVRAADTSSSDSALPSALTQWASNALRAQAPTSPTNNLRNSSPSSDSNPNQQDQKEQFLEKARAHQTDHYLSSVRTPPLSHYVLTAGTRIPAVLDQAVNSDVPGEMVARVRNNVYTAQAALVIPQNSKLVGRYNSSIAYGQNRVQVVWDRLIFPDQSSIDLAGLNGQDRTGASGLKDKVDNHWKRLVAEAAITSGFAAGIALTQRRGNPGLGYGYYPSVSDSISQAVGQQLSELGSQLTSRNANRQPTIQIRVGTPFFVFVNRDILFEAPYEPMAPAASVDGQQ